MIYIGLEVSTLPYRSIALLKKYIGNLLHNLKWTSKSDII